MSIRFKSNFVVAKKVLAQVNKKISKDVAKDCSIEVYANGEEQGYCIFSTHIRKNTKEIYSPLRVSFSEYRNSDDIVIYAGNSYDFKPSGNIPNENVYRQGKFFRYGDNENAAQFIVNFLTLGK